MAGPVTVEPTISASAANPTNDFEKLLLEQMEAADKDQSIPDAAPSATMNVEQINEARNSGPLGAFNRAISPPKVLDAVAEGAIAAGMQTKDFIFGEPEEEDKSTFRQAHEQNSQALKESGFINSAAYSISQMVTGLIGAGKLMKPIKFLQGLRNGGKVARAAYEIAKGAAASTVVLDPHEERLSDLIESYPALQNPVTDYLSANEGDSAAEGRFKNAIESIGLDFALVGAVKVVKLLRAGKQDEALKEIRKLEAGGAAPQVDAALMPSGDRAAQANGRIVEAPETRIPDSEVPGGADTVVSQAERKAQASVRAVEEPQVVTQAEPATATPTASSLPDGINRQATAENVTTAPPGVKAADDAGYRPTELSDDDVKAILKGAADEEAAIKKFGSKEAATEAGQVLSRVSTLPWQKLRGSEEVLSFVNRAAKVRKAEMDAAKGGAIMSDSSVSEMVHARAGLFGEDPEMVLGQIQEAGSAARDMVATMETSYLLANRMFQETYDAAFRLRNGMLDEWGGDVVKAEKELKARLMASADLLASARSMSSNSGRALRRLRGVHQFKPEDLAKVQDMDGQRLADLIFQTKGDPKQLAQVANPTFLSRVLDEATFSLTNSLLWLWPTHVTNITSSVLMLAGRPTEKLLGSFAVGPKAGGDIMRQQAIKEYAYTVASLGDAWTALKDAFVRGDSILSPHNTEFFGGGAASRTAQQPLPWKPVKSITDLAQNAWMAVNYRNIVGLPTRSLGAVDEFFKTLRYRAYVQAEAATKANAAGFKGDEFQRFVQEKMDAAIDPATGQALDQRALHEAQVTTFQQELLKGTAGATIQQVRARHPILTFVVPFVKTPVNVLRYSWKMTPGLNLLQKEFRDNLNGLNGAEAKAHAYGQMTLGATFMSLSAMMALSGKMTGGGPTDPTLQKELRATGWQPYSYVIDLPDGSRRFIPMGRLDPTSMVMTMMADMVEALRHDPENEETQKGIGALAFALAKNFSDKTFLQNIHQALEALSDTTGDKGEKYLAGIAGNTIPLSSALRGVNPDPYLREARSFIDNVLKNVPGYSQTLPPSRDAFGEPVARRIGLSTTSHSDIVEAENIRMMLETGKQGVGKPDPKFEGVDLRDITLKSGQNAYDRLQELSGQLPKRKSLKEYLAGTIQSQAYQDMPDGAAGVKGTRQYAIGLTTEQYRSMAKKALVSENPELRELIGARQRAARGAYIENRQRRQQGEPGGRELLKALTGTN